MNTQDYSPQEVEQQRRQEAEALRLSYLRQRQRLDRWFLISFLLLVILGSGVAYRIFEFWKAGLLGR